MVDEAQEVGKAVVWYGIFDALMSIDGCIAAWGEGGVWRENGIAAERGLFGQGSGLVVVMRVGEEKDDTVIEILGMR